MVIAAVRDNTYNLVLFLHIVTVLVAFAPAVVHPLTFERMRGDSSFGRIAGIAADNGRKIYFPSLVVTGLLGIIMILLSDDLIGFSELWISLSFLVWIAICGLVSGMIMPNERKVAAGDTGAARKVTLAGQITTVLLLVMLYLMIFKPGSDLT
jgi:uncharacterized membrane protein